MSNMLPIRAFRHMWNAVRFFHSSIQQTDHDYEIKYGAYTSFGENVCIEPNVVIGSNCRIGCNTVIRTGARIGDDCDIGHLVVIEQGVKIGTTSTVQSQCHITAFVEVGSKVFFGPGVVCANDKQMVKYHPERGDYIVEAPVFEDGCSIGAGSVIMPGVTIGKNAMIGSGSVVSKSVPEDQTWYGFGAKCRE